MRGVFVLLLLVGCRAPGARAPEQDPTLTSRPTLLLDCGCGDGTRQTLCSDVSNCVDALTVCEDECADKDGAALFTCLEHNLGCAIGENRGENGVVCGCDGLLIDAAACVDVACDDPAVDDACAAACGGVATPRCSFDAQCLSLGLPVGADALSCRCSDDSLRRACIGDLIGAPISADLACDDICGGTGTVELHTPSDVGCVLGAATGDSFVDCDCIDDGTSACVDVDCASDAAAIEAACAAVCAEDTSPSPRCEPDDRGCVERGVASGDAGVHCECNDGTTVTSCVSRCGPETCPAVCDAHDGWSGSAPCAGRDLACLLDDVDGGPHGFVCACANGGGQARCVDDCAGVDAICDDYCGFDGGAASCAVDDAGCAAVGFPSGPEALECSCGFGGEVVAVCISSCGHGVNATPLCRDLCEGGFVAGCGEAAACAP